MRALRPVLTGSLVISLLFGALAPGAGADTSTDAGIAWLEVQQEADGGFELAGFPPFETPDALLAIAANAQTSAVWNEVEARAAVEGLTHDALAWLDDFAEGPGLTPGTAAKLILLSALPLGDEPTAYDPVVDGTPVDLTENLDEIDPGLFNSFLFGRLAEAALGQNVHQVDLQIICEAQKRSGGWSFNGAPTGASADLDSTGFAVMALIAAGVPADDPVLVDAATFIERRQQASGAWPSFGADDPNATALAMMAWRALGLDLDDLDSDPVDWLQTLQIQAPNADAGRFPSPNDGYGVNTFATSQALQALFLARDPEAASWLPVAPSGTDLRCLTPHGYRDVPANAWYDDGARWVDETGIVAGFDGAMVPKGSVKRQQAAMWLNLMFGGVGGDPHPFVDVPANAWYREGVNFVGGSPNGVIATGYGDRFRPKLTLNRAQAVSWLYAAAGSPPVDDLAAHGFTDVGPNHWYEEAVTWAKANGVASGFADSTFRGKGDVNRAQFAQWMFTLAATPEAWSASAVIAPTNLFGAP